MLFKLPNDQILYDALLARDPSYEGQAYVCVKTTGIFCRLTCPARKPKKENCEFLETVSECMDAGFRPCKRCKPLDSLADQDPVVTNLLEVLRSDPEKRWGEQDIIDMGYDPSTIRRTFKRTYGVTFLQIARLTRLKSGIKSLENGGRVIDAQLDANYQSGSGFRTALTRLLGHSPANITGNECLKANWIESPIGPIMAVADQHALHLLEFFDRKALPNELKKLQTNLKQQIGIGRTKIIDQIEEELQAYFNKKLDRFKTKLAFHGSDFTKNVWDELVAIPSGETRSYLDIAKSMDKKNAVRAVARANGANQIAIVIPCHRVIGSDGALTGYGGGLWRKQWLLEHEKTS